MSKGREDVAQTLIPAALAAGGVGVWQWDIAQDRVLCDEATARLFGVMAETGFDGASLAIFIDAIHDEDRADFVRQITGVQREGGLFVTEYRTQPQVGVVRWVLARGRFDREANGKVTHGRGIVIDITDSKYDGQAHDPAFFMSSAAPPQTALDRLAQLSIEARQTADEVEASSSNKRLRPLVDALLWEVGRMLAAAVRNEPPDEEPDPKPPAKRRTSKH